MCGLCLAITSFNTTITTLPPTTWLFVQHHRTMSKSPITCHVLDSTLGKPATNVRVQLEALSPLNSQFHILATGATNSDGRCPDLMAGQKAEEVLVAKGVYKMTFYTGEYFEKAGRSTFYPQVEVSVLALYMIQEADRERAVVLICNLIVCVLQILFQLSESPDPHYHIPLLLSPFSYTTYRGS